MKTDITQIPLTNATHCVHLKTLPFMPAVFCKLLALSLVRKPALPEDTRVCRGKLLLPGFVPDPDKVDRYCKVCGFFRTTEDNTIPPSCLQTLFIGMLGRYITANFFPINPMGLIQTGQSFASKHPVMVNDLLDLSCTLQEMTRTPRGIVTRFCLEIHRENALVWQGISTYLTRDPGRVPPKKKPISDQPLPVKRTILVPENTGRRYARVSGDYNPHHLSAATAKLIGFKQAIAHGMWSLARTMACLEETMPFSHPFCVDAAFKLPIYLPATLTLGYERVPGTRGQVKFELRDADKGLPHLKGTLLFQDQENRL
ncbi:MAG: MaoC/PaaZ C-terminal domain-containing protein [Desulfotignum sp.]|jgi:acyl dehydratase|nr:MaoC/PaaZ C-terminal domain-containing protein [Desulfotignum sp.]